MNAEGQRFEFVGLHTFLGCDFSVASEIINASKLNNETTIPNWQID